MKGKAESITVRVLAAMDTEDGSWQDVEQECINERLKGLEEWLNGMAGVDSFYAVYMLEMAAEGLKARLSRHEQKMLKRLKERSSIAVISSPAIKKEG